MRQVRLLVAVAIACCSSVSFGAELLIHSEDPVYLEDRGTTCQIELRGEITVGDADKVTNFLDLHAEKLQGTPFWIQGGDGYDLCLDSPGGSYAEGLALVDVISDRKVGTRIRSDGHCASACAVAFMAGTVFVDADFSLRVLQPGGKLGFHAPSIELPGTAEIPTAMVKIAYERALADIAGVMNRLAINSEWGTEARLSAGLLAKMMSTPPDSMFYLTSLNEVGIWNIDLHYPGQDSVNLSEANLAQACNNFGHWIDGVNSGGVGSVSDTAGVIVRNIDDQRAKANERVVEIEIHGVYYKYCRFFIPTDLKRIGEGDIRLAVISEESSREGMFTLSVWQFLNPEMTLDDVALRGAN